VFASLGPAGAENSPPLWLRYPAISPDGQTLLFAYKGDIWSVPAAGGNAIPLTLSESYEFAPVWSHDGKSVAFASDRYGNFDVFVMPSDGGEAKRLTYHSPRRNPERVHGRRPRRALQRHAAGPATHVQFPTGGMSELYSVPVAGGRVSIRPDDACADATSVRRATRSSSTITRATRATGETSHVFVTRDIWVYDTKANKYTQLSTFNGEDRNPVFDANDDDFYYLSERSGSSNVFKSSLRNPGQSRGVTRFTTNPVRFLTRARNGRWPFSYDGELYTMRPGGEPTKVAVSIGADGRNTIEKILPVSGGMTEAAARPERERVRLRVPRRSLRQQHRRQAGETRHEHVVAGTQRQFQSGRAVARLRRGEGQQLERLHGVAHARERAVLLRVDGAQGRGGHRHTGGGIPAQVLAGRQDIAYLETGRRSASTTSRRSSRTPSSPAISITRTPTATSTTPGRPIRSGCSCSSRRASGCSRRKPASVAADGASPVRNLTQSGYDDATPKWAMDGKMMIWGTTRDGALSQGGGAVSGDVYGCTSRRRLMTGRSCRKRNSRS
jgi:hypothetical protein